ncbi:Casparian strip membrane protein [Parasponia andersonii]|uniref:CASP-like protein n=1 Tax=Parasponia andersonii TaxID=3476 RepID=A0A2P5DVA2_PARAD|nr:Casparian strip membrane protein [Parasponia andersonii]
MATTEDKFQQNPPLKTQNLFLGAQIFLRVLALAVTLAASWIVLTSKQTILILGMAFDARYSYSPAMKFFAMANGIACAFSAISLFFVSFLRRHFFNPNHYFFLFLHDLLVLLLVLAGCAAATTIGYVGQYGNNHSGWSPICDHFQKYCKRVTASVAFSYLSVMFFLMLTIISASKSRQIHV